MASTSSLGRNNDLMIEYFSLILASLMISSFLSVISIKEKKFKF